MTGRNENRNALIAAALIMLFFGAGLYFMPRIMLAVGKESAAVAGVLAVAFVAAFFLVFWLRSKMKGNGGR